MIGWAITAMLCGLFLLDTRGSRNLFYFVFLPSVVLAFDWRTLPRLSEAPILRSTSVYFIVGLTTFYWRDQFDPVIFEDLARFLNVGLALGVGVALLSRHKNWIYPLYQCIGIAAAVSVVLSVGLYWDSLSEGWRLKGIGNINENLLASSYGAAALGLLFIVLPKETDVRRRVVPFAIAALAFIGLWLTGSRGPLLAFAIASLVGAYLHSAKTALLTITGTLFIFVAMTATGLIDPTALVERGDGYRLMLWNESFLLALERPWFGFGYGTDFMFATDIGLNTTIPHNMFISHVLLGGVIWLAAFIALLAVAFTEAWKRHLDGQSGLVVLLLYGLICMTFDFHIVIVNLGAQWLFFWLPIAILASLQLQRGKDNKADFAGH